MIEDFKYKLDTWLGKTGSQKANKPPSQVLVITTLVVIVVSMLTIVEMNRPPAPPATDASTSK